MKIVTAGAAIVAAAALGIAARGDAPFVASTNRSFAELMADATHRMHEGMAAPPTGNPDEDFVIQMIPHHQGAIDMAEALLVHGKDPELRQLAKSIIAEQQNEIQIMRSWQRRHRPPPTKGNDR